MAANHSFKLPPPPPSYLTKSDERPRFRFNILEFRWLLGGTIAAVFFEIFDDSYIHPTIEQESWKIVVLMTEEADDIFSPPWRPKTIDGARKFLRERWSLEMQSYNA